MSGTPAKQVRKASVKRYRMALQILAALKPKSTQAKNPPLSLELAQELARLQRLEQIAASRGCNLAAARLREDIVRALKRISGSVYQSLDAIGENSKPAFGCSALDIVNDLKALERDFADVELDLKNQTISVTTEPIELDGTYFGEFQVVLELRYLGESHPYHVIAKDPQTAAASDLTTHPHVQGESLCEGDGGQPIKHALAGGRIHDFFRVVHQILQTYNASSAYTLLSNSIRKNSIVVG